MRTGIALLLLAGCESFFPLNVDATQVSGKLVTTLVENSADGVPAVVDNAPPPDGLTMTVTVDGVTSNVDFADDGTFGFERRDRDYRLVINTETGGVLEVQDDADTIAIPILRAGRDGVSSGATTVMVPDMDARRRLVSTGQWSDNVLVSGTASFAWQAAQASGGRPIGLLDGTRNDRLFLLEFSQNAALEVTVTKASEFGPTLVMTDGGTIDMPPPQPVTPNGCIRFATALGDSQARLGVAIADVPLPVELAYANTITAHTVLATPSTRLQSQVVTSLGDVSRDLMTTQDFVFHDPLPAHQHLAMASAAAARQVKFPTATTTVEAFSGMTVFQDVTGEGATCDDGDRATFDQALAFPRRPSLGGQLLDEDDVEIHIVRPGTVALTWELDGGGVVDSYDVVLYEVTGPGGKTSITPVRQYLVSGREIQIDDQTLGPNKHYIVQIFASIGRHEAATGDYATTDYPIGFGMVLTSTFFVPQ